MTEEKLKRCNQVSKLLNKEIKNLSEIDTISSSTVGSSLKSLLLQDEEFKKYFQKLIAETKVRLSKEFNEI